MRLLLPATNMLLWIVYIETVFCHPEYRSFSEDPSRSSQASENKQQWNKLLKVLRNDILDQVRKFRVQRSLTGPTSFTNSKTILGVGDLDLHNTNSNKGTVRLGSASSLLRRRVSYMDLLVDPGTARHKLFVMTQKRQSGISSPTRDWCRMVGHKYCQRSAGK